MNIDKHVDEKPKVKRRKSRSERNRIKEKKLKTVVDEKEKVDFVKSLKQIKYESCSNERKATAKDTFEKTKAVIGNNRLTRRLGLFNQAKASETIVCESNSKFSLDKEKETEKDLIKFLDSDVAVSEKRSLNIDISDIFEKAKENLIADLASSLQEDNIMSNKFALDKLNSKEPEVTSNMFPRRLAKSASTTQQRNVDVDMSAECKSPMDIDEKSDIFPSSPDFNALADMLSSTLSCEKYFPGKSLYQNTRHELHQLIRKTSPAIELVERYTPTMSSAAIKTPRSQPHSRKTTPHSHQSSKKTTPMNSNINQATFTYKGSLSSETVKRPGDSQRKVTPGHLPERFEMCVRNQKDVRIPQKQINSLPFQVNYYTDLSEQTKHKHKKPTDVIEGNFLTEDALTNARALIGCNEKVSERSQSSQDIVMNELSQELSSSGKKYSDVTFASSKRNDTIDNIGKELYDINYDIEKKMKYSRTGRPVQENKRDVNHHHYYQSERKYDSYSRRKEIQTDLGRVFHGNSNSAKPENYFEHCYSKPPLADHNYNLQNHTQRHGRHNQYENYSNYRDAYVDHQHGDGLWNPRSINEQLGNDLNRVYRCKHKKDSSRDILDFIDREPFPMDYSAEVKKKPKKTRLTHATPDSDGSPAWYASFKPSPLSESPEKMYPRKLY